MAAASLGGRRPSGAVCGEDAEVKWSREKTCTVQHMLKKHCWGWERFRGELTVYILQHVLDNKHSQWDTLCLWRGYTLRGFYERVLKGKNGFQLIADFIFHLLQIH